MKRRAILVAGGAWLGAIAAPLLAQTGRPRRIAFLHPGSQAGFQMHLDAFRAVLKELGHVEGRDISIEVRWANDRTERLDAFAAEGVALNPDLIVTATSAGIAAFKKATASIPIVFASGFNPVEQGFISSLQRPGGNITGVIVYSDLTPKIIEVAREALPDASRLALLIHEADPAHKFTLEAFEPNARRFNFQPVVVRVARAEDLDRAFAELAAREVHAVIAAPLAFFTSNRRALAERALKARLPLLANNFIFADSGGLLSYGTSIEENYRRAAGLVDKILRGAKPGELPVQRPERFVLVVNRKTAAAIGVKLSPVTVLRADRIIE
jgi:ABC-type uncharacterized transport system substrate-binding protein